MYIAYTNNVAEQRYSARTGTIKSNKAYVISNLVFKEDGAGVTKQLSLNCSAFLHERKAYFWNLDDDVADQNVDNIIHV